MVPAAPTTRKNENETKKVSKQTEKTSPTPTSTSTAMPDATTMNPDIQSAYEAFMAYLDQERFLRKVTMTFKSKCTYS